MSELDKKERMLDLLINQACYGLSGEEQKEFEMLRIEFPDLAGDSSLEEIASVVAMTAVDSEERMPEQLAAKVMASADSYFDSKVSAAEKSPSETEELGSTVQHVPQKVVFETPKRPFWQWFGWAIAGAACIALIVNVWMTRLQPTEIADGPSTRQTPKTEPSLAELRQQLLASAGDVLKTGWTSPANDKDLAGEVVWSDAEQKGYMTFKGLAVNDVSKETYQLWIFDETQDEKTPVDGGIFDIDKSGEVIVPINAKLKVKKPKMFAVTVEKPGGVVVSKREMIVALAKV